MKKILVAFLGNAEYQETTYQIEDKQYKDRLAFIPIYNHFHPIDIAYVIGTKESKWEMIKDFSHKPIEIPYGKSETDFWEMFDVLTKNIDIKDAEVIFDITHCFRAIPIFTAIYIRFLKYVEPTANFSHIFYGSFEKGKDLTPIVDLAPLLDLLDWIDATTSFIKYGELEDLSKKVKIANDKAWKQEGIEKRPKTLGMFSKRIGELSDLSRLTYIPLLSEVGKELSPLLEESELKEELQNYSKPFVLLINRLAQYIARFAKPSLWESHLEAAKWYLENKRPTQALLVLREVVLTYHCERYGCDPYEIKSREKRERALNDKRQKSKKPIIRLWQKITDARNRAGHALMRRQDKTLSPSKAITDVENLIKETEKVLREDV